MKRWAGVLWVVVAVVGVPGVAAGAEPDPEAVRRLMEQYEREAKAAQRQEQARKAQATQRREAARQAQAAKRREAAHQAREATERSGESETDFRHSALDTVRQAAQRGNATVFYLNKCCKRLDTSRYLRKPYKQSHNSI